MGLFDRIYGDKAKTAEDTPTIAEVVEQAKAHEVWGRPGQCPQCGGKGYLDRIDVIDRVMYQHCTDCYHKWSVAEADTVPA
jgi:hypothetical protein